MARKSPAAATRQLTGEATPLPESFFTEVISQVKDVAELKVILHFSHLLSRKQGHPGAVTHDELLAHCVPVMGEKEFRKGLKLAIKRGVILSSRGDAAGGEEVYLSRREAEAAPKPAPLKPNIFALYEENIGLITPLIAEELKEAEKRYPGKWIEEAFREAVAMNKRSWRYIARILENWASGGKDSGAHRPGAKKSDPNKYIRGRYGHLVKR